MTKNMLLKKFLNEVLIYFDSRSIVQFERVIREKD